MNEEHSKSPEYQSEDYDLQEAHAALERENPEPQEGSEPLPVWLVIGLVLISYWGIGYLFYNDGGFRYDVFDEKADAPPVVKAVTEEEMPLVTLGEKKYSEICVACHQPNGKGLPGAFPPLAGSDWVAGPPERIIPIVLNGAMGPITVSGATYNGVMAPWKDSMNDRQIAAVLTYIRQAWGNQAPEVSPELVKTLRDQYGSRATAWTQEELLKLAP